MSPPLIRDVVIIASRVGKCANATTTEAGAGNHTRWSRSWSEQ
ncbi:uncharacterized protein RCC_00335 [Ramularia collo-cygni]|uniref:Uncharacterized protein n=1 Tax=Ramularia collo-cygni TaxID=112498 RepID=A0A2D3UMW5_9PEZI|nr:uncharacterized protein RCC_00335 [Ramularia collo-cygni]CZT14358.1 uncharacterized protein RCC_00335 [Ramularia collo-cygni]